MAIQVPKLSFKMPSLPLLDRLGPRMRRVLRYTGFALFGLLVFVFALQATFPYGRVKDKLIELMAEKYDVTIGGVERGWLPGRVAFKAFTVRTRPTSPGESITTFYVDRLEIDLGLLPLIGGTIDVDITAKIGRGEIVGNVRLGKFGQGDITASIEGNRLAADALPMRMAIGLPMTGKLEFDVNLDLPVEKSKGGKTAINWQKASGAIALSCPGGCTFGDGESKLKPLLKNTRSQVMVGDGIDFGKVTMDKLVAKVTIKDSKLTLDTFEADSKDGVLKVDYMMTLEKEFGRSMVAGCLRFKGSDDLMRREPKTHAALSTTGAELRNDGLFHIRLTGNFSDMKRLNQECGPSTNIGNNENFDQRPNLTIQPEPAQPTLPAPPPTTTTPTPAEPTTPPPATPTPDPGTEAPPAESPPPAAPVGAAPAGTTPTTGAPEGSGSDAPPPGADGERIDRPYAPGSAGAPTGEAPQPAPAMPPPEE